MHTTSKRTLALFVLLAQLFALLPVLSPRAEAAGTQTAPEQPALNKTVVGTVRFQSFNFLGDNDTGEDGTDYVSTFFYTDDYFSHSAVNDAADQQVETWRELDDPSLAACSMNFAVASYTSAEGDVIRASSQSWNNADYSDKDKNVRLFLGDCGFTNIEPHGLTERPTMDSIGYTLGSKQITVYDQTSGQNKTYTLIAVGCRGAGYGAEWASNVTIGDTSTSAIPANGRHYGFDHSAQLVCEGIRDYLSNHNITGDVKYWVTGFSRAAAVANLVSGYLTDGGSTYKTQQKDVYGYTWECPQAAKKADTNFTNYKNIHNIVNPMDAVPKVSPDAFEHQRLGVDYQMPYHATPNLTKTQNTSLYKNMYSVLQTIVDADDPLIEAVDPNNYPYDRVMTIYKMDGSDLMGQVVSYVLGTDTDTLMKEFGTVEAEHKHKGGLLNLITYGNVSSLLGWNGGSDYKTTTWYLDDFINNLVTVFLTSNAWVGGTGNGRTALQNRATFISNYQNDFRTLFGYFLDFSGPAFLGMVPKLVDAVTSNIGSSLTSGFAWYFVRFYNDPSDTSKKNNLISASKTLAVNVANDMVSGFPDPEYQGITKAQMNAAMQNLAELVINLYSYELSEYDSQYLGTTLRYLNTILCTHEQETVLSWIESLDDNYISDVREVTLPATASVDLYAFRDGIEGALPADKAVAAGAQGALVARIQNGAFVNLTGAEGKTYDRLDDRITLSQNGSNIIIRYPGTVDYRIDVRGSYTDVPVQVADYVPSSTTNTKSTAARDTNNKNHITQTTAIVDGTNMVVADNTSSASTLNTYSNRNNIALQPAETLSILAWNGSNQVLNKQDATYALYRTARKTELVDFSGTRVVAQQATLASSTSYSGTFASTANRDVTYTTRKIGTASTAAFSAVADTAMADKTAANAAIGTGEKITVIPSSSVYYDDDITGAVTSDGHGNSPTLQASPAGSDLDKGVHTFTFTGTGIDVYCTTYDTLDGNSAGYVQAKLDGKNDTTVTMRSQSDVTRYNVPTISFTGLSYGEHTLTLNILNSSHYRLDGVRIYGAVEDQTLYDGTDEQYAAYINLRAALVNDRENYQFQDDTGTVTIGDQANVVKTGALNVDDPDQLALQQTNSAGTEVTVYQNDFEAYKANSPKNEIYLESGKAITFRLSSAAQSGRLWIGLSAPEAETVTVSTDAKVTINNGTPTPVTSAVDMYYPITLASGQTSVTIENTGSAMIAVTNLKITGSPAVYNAVANAAGSSAAPSALNEAVFEPVTLQSLRLAANGGFDPDAQPVETDPPAGPEVPETSEADRPGWNTDADSAPALISALMRTLLDSLSELFRDLPGW